MAAKAKAKSKAKRRKEISEVVSPKAQKKLDRRIRRLLDEVDEQADERFQYAEMILKNNPPEVQDAVDAMVEVMTRMAGVPRFKVDGIYVNVTPQILARINKKLHTWAAVRLLVAGAMWDIRVANFTLPKKRCARCGKKVKR